MLISLKEYAQRHGKEPATARQRAGRGAFKTAVKIGRDWLIDEDEEWTDARIHSGIYINARKKREKEVDNVALE